MNVVYIYRHVNDLDAHFRTCAPDDRLCNKSNLAGQDFLAIFIYKTYAPRIQTQRILGHFQALKTGTTGTMNKLFIGKFLIVSELTRKQKDILDCMGLCA